VFLDVASRFNSNLVLCSLCTDIHGVFVEHSWTTEFIVAILLILLFYLPDRVQLLVSLRGWLSESVPSNTIYTSIS
jgi:hypothetical protein